VDDLSLKVDEIHRFILLEARSKKGKPGHARSGLYPRKPTPRRLSVFCWTTLDIGISNSTPKNMVRWGWSVIRTRRRQDIAVVLG